MDSKRRSPKKPAAKLPITAPVPRLFGQAMAAAYLGLSERAFEYRWRKYELPHPHRLGRRLVWDRMVLDEWVDVLSGLDRVNEP